MDSLITDADVAKLCEEWLKTFEGDRNASNRERRRILEAFLSKMHGPSLSMDALLAISADDVRKAIGAMSAKGRAPKTVNHLLSNVRSFFSFLAKRGYKTDPHIQKVKNVAWDRKGATAETLDRKQAEALIDATGQWSRVPWEAARDIAVLTLCHEAGLRITRCLALTLTELESGTLQAVEPSGAIRAVELPEPAKLKIRAYLELCPFTVGADEPIFRGPTGDMLAWISLRYRFKKARSQMGLSERLTLESFRLSHARQLHDAGVDVIEAQRSIGNTWFNTTTGRRDVSDEEMLEAYLRTHPRP